MNLSKGSKAIGCRWVFRKKDDEQYKARLVAKGYSQESIDYNEILSHVVKHTSIQLLLTTMTQGDLELDQLNVKIIFFTW